MSEKKVEAQLLAEPIGHLGLSDYCIVTADTSVRDTIQRMRITRQNCAFVVGEGTHIIGIFTDRDVLKKIATSPATWDQPVSEVMTKSPNTLPASATTDDAIKLMGKGHYRNVPVVEGNVIIGNVNHFAILKYLTEHFPEAIYNLPPAPENYADSRAGG